LNAIKSVQVFGFDGVNIGTVRLRQQTDDLCFGHRPIFRFEAATPVISAEGFIEPVKAIP
jgi:hypothetical protein